MSQHDVTTFLTRLTEDPSLRAQVDVSGKTCDQQILALVLLGSGHGFEFTPDEVKSVLDSVMAAGRESDEADAAKVRTGIRLTLDPCLGDLEYLGRPCKERLRTPHGVRPTRNESSR